MKSIVKKIPAVILLFLVLMAFPVPVSAAEADTPASGKAAAEMTETAAAETAADLNGNKAWAAAACVGVPAAVGAIGMAWAITKASEGISRQPEADGKIRTGMMLGLVFIETAIIYALIIAILIIFVL